MRNLLLVALAAIAYSGEWVTSDDTGERVCQLQVNIFYGMVWDASMCTNWQQQLRPFPQGAPAPEHWYRCTHGCQLHFENGWRP
jgi:hypothetical protein